MPNTFGHVFRITTFGESHGPAVGVVVDGCPPGLSLADTDVQRELDRRRPGQSRLTTQRKEPDLVRILSGVYEGKTLGTPILMLVESVDARSVDYDEMARLYRPSHADYTTQVKYGHRDWRGGGRASARETVGRVAGGALARLLLARDLGVSIVGWVSQVHTIEAPAPARPPSIEDVDATPVRCPDAPTARKMILAIERARKAGDSLGGVVTVVARGVPPGLGEPVFDKLEADLAKALLSLPASKGFEVGSGFAGVRMTGSQHNDPFYNARGRIRTRTNHSGGIQGGISNGEDIVVRVAFKPTATIMMEQETVDQDGKPARIKGRGRHDPCVVPRAVPICEAMVALVLADHHLRQRALRG